MYRVTDFKSRRSRYFFSRDAAMQQLRDSHCYLSEITPDWRAALAEAVVWGSAIVLAFALAYQF